jgi:hypothetical protein
MWREYSRRVAKMTMSMVMPKATVDQTIRERLAWLTVEKMQGKTNGVYKKETRMLF